MSLRLHAAIRQAAAYRKVVNCRIIILQMVDAELHKAQSLGLALARGIRLGKP